MARTQVQSELIATNAISGTIIADNAITATHIATNAISGTLVQSSGITTDMIASNNVTAAKIVSDGIETRHLHSNVISGQSSVTAASGDYVLIGDTSDSNNLKKALVSDFGVSGISSSADATAITIDSSENVTFSGTISNSGDTNGEVAHRLQNVNAGNATESSLYITNAAANASGLALGATGTGFTAAGGYVQDGAHVVAGTGASGGLSIMTRAAADMRFYTNGHTNERMRITSAGDVGIGVTAPTETLVVSGDTDVTGQMYLGPNDNDRRPFAKPSNWGYSSGYKAIILGSTSATYHTSISGAVTLSFNYDPSGNSNGSFSGNGNEILFRNGTQFATPNSDDDAFNLKNLVLKDGYVGIGTATPARELDIQATSGWAELALRGASGSGGSLEFWTTSTKRAEIFADTEDIVFRNTASNTERMRILSGGSVLIGTTSLLQSDNKVSIAGSATGAGSGVIDIRNTSSNDNCGVISLSKATTTTSSASRYIYFYASNFGTNMGAIGGNGTGNVAFVATSDERLKENIQPITGSLDKVLALNPVSFDWKENGEHREAGFVAQEVEKVLPEYVNTEDDEMKTKSITGGMTAGYIAVLTKAIQELEARIKTLEDV